MKNIVLGVIATCLVGFGCNEEAPLERPTFKGSFALSVLPNSTEQVDVLFVIDDSTSMLDQRAVLASKANEMLEALVGPEGDPLDLHVGVVSTDMGAGSFQYPGCSPSAERGVLVTDDCLPEGSNNYAEFGGTSSDVTNREDIVACMVQRTEEGCGFEQPLEAMRRALDPTNTDNQGFLRQDALLAVIIVSDEDDCSALDPGLFDPNEFLLGPVDSFRCFEQGVTCDSNDLRELGPKDNCRPMESSPYLYDVGEYIDFLNDLKGSPFRSLVATIGGRGEVEIERRGENVALKSVCSDSEEEEFEGVYPAPRLDAFVDGSWGMQGDLCTDRMSTAVQLCGAIADRAQQKRCLPSGLRDGDQAMLGTQPHCEIRSESWVDGVLTKTSELNLCRGEDNDSCVSYIADSSCESGIALSSTTLAGDETLVVSCDFERQE